MADELAGLSYLEIEQVFASRKRALLACRTSASASTASASPYPLATIRVAPLPTASVVAPAATSTAMIASAVATAVAAERVRIREILESSEAEGREKSAATIAYGGGFTSTQARNFLSTCRLDEEVEVDLAAKQIAQFGRSRGARLEGGP